MLPQIKTHLYSAALLSLCLLSTAETSDFCEDSSVILPDTATVQSTAVLTPAIRELAVIFAKKHGRQSLPFSITGELKEELRAVFEAERIAACSEQECTGISLQARLFPATDMLIVLLQSASLTVCRSYKRQGERLLAATSISIGSRTDLKPEASTDKNRERRAENGR